MALPTQQTVHDDVVVILTLFSGRKPHQIHDDHDLQKDLQLTSDRLTALALSLRGYIKSHNPAGTISAKEVKKADTTVLKLTGIVFDKIKEAA